MPSGGARARSGPARDPQSARSDKLRRSVRVLTGESRRGVKPPRFPLPKVTIFDTVEGERIEVEGASKVVNDRERALWRWAWQQPQAEVWSEQTFFAYLVAQWVRLAVKCEDPDAMAADKNAMLRLADQIGLSPSGLALNGWVIGSPEVVSESADAGRSRARGQSSRDRMAFRVVNGGGD